MNAVNATRSELAAIGPGSLRVRLDSLLQHSITLESFEADVTRLCQVNSEEIWAVLALLDQYHRRGLLPTPLFRTLKASADRRSLARQGAMLPPESKATVPVPAPTPPPAPAVPAAAMPAAAPAPAPATAPAAVTIPVPASTLPAPAPTAASEPVAAAATPGSLPVAAPATTLPPGTVLCNRYVLEALLGRGVRGTVYRALDRERGKLPQPRQHVAVKMLRPQLLAEAGVLANLRVEFQCAQSLSHQNIVNVFELEQDGPLTFMTMELLDGEPLSTLLERYGRQPLPRAIAMAIIRDLGAALVHAHERGVVHGDLQPRHIMITANGEVRITNFAAARSSTVGPEPDTNIYASCEALAGQLVDRRDDLYALACISYQLLAGHHPFNGLNAAQARGRALVPRRPAQLGRGPWRALRAGLAWRRENRTVGIGWWLSHLDLGAAAPQLPALSELCTPPPAQRRNLWRPALLFACLGVAIAAAAALDALPSPQRLTHAWSVLRTKSFDNPLQRLGDWLSPTEATPVTVESRATTPSRRTPPVAAGVQKRARPGSAEPAAPATAPAADASVITTAEAPAGAPLNSAHNSTGTAKGTTRLAVASSSSPPQRIELSTDNYSVLPGEPAARIEVRRRGNLQGDVSFVWSTVGASAQPERDFIASGTRAEQIPAGVNSVTLLVPIVSNPTRTDSRVFYVTIAEPAGGAELGPNTRASVLIAGGN